MSDTQDAFDNTDATINSVNNYQYDEIGNLIYNKQDDIESVTWAVFNKPLEIKRINGSTLKNVRFEYDALHNRIAKHIYNNSDVHEYSEYYVYDAQGNLLATVILADNNFTLPQPVPDLLWEMSNSLGGVLEAKLVDASNMNPLCDFKLTINDPLFTTWDDITGFTKAEDKRQIDGTKLPLQCH